MFRKLMALAITTGLAAGLYRQYLNKREQGAAEASSRTPVATRRRRRAGTQGETA